MDLFHILVALGLVALNAFFVAAEYAIVRVRASRIEEMVSRGVRRAAATREVLRNLNAYISTCQLGVTFASLGLGWIGEPAFVRLVEPALTGLGSGRLVASHTVAAVLSFLLITFVLTVFGELAPKSIVIARATTVALWVAWPIRIFRMAFYPLIVLLHRSADFVVGLLGLTPDEPDQLAHTEHELRMILAVSHRSGALSSSHSRLIENVLDFTDRTVRQVMVPRGDVVFLDANRGYDENLLAAREAGHTRYPLCEADLDHVVGVVHIKDLFLAQPADGGALNLRDLARDPLFIPESLQIEQVLETFQKRRLHMGIAIDEYGGTSGLITLEDVLEQLIGEIQDEFDQEAPLVQTLPDGRLSVDAALPVTELEEHIGIPDFTDEEVDTLGGLVVTRLGRIARVGDAVEIAGRKVEVARMRGRRILRVIVSRGDRG